MLWNAPSQRAYFALKELEREMKAVFFNFQITSYISEHYSVKITAPNNLFKQWKFAWITRIEPTSFVCTKRINLHLKGSLTVY